MLCLKCGFEGNPNLEESGPHTKAICRQCGAYIKMVSKDELNHLIHADDDNVDTPTITNLDNEETKLIIKTTAPKDYMPLILKRIKIGMEKGYICGDGTVTKPFDDESYTYEFYYR